MITPTQQEDWIKTKSFDFPFVYNLADFVREFYLSADPVKQAEELSRFASFQWINAAPADVREAILSAAGTVVKGDFVGHPFRGNQWTDSSGAGSGSAAGGASYVHAQTEDEASDLVVQITAGNKPSTKAQSNAIQYYGEQGFQMINNFLRYGQDLEFESDAERDKILNSIEELNTVLNQQTLGVNVVLQRFVDGDIFGELEVGDEYQDEAFQSTSLRGNREITDLFGAKLLIRAPANTRGRYIEADKSRNHSEFEVLLAAGAKYKVVSVVDNGNWKEVVVDLIGQGGDLEPIKN